MKDNNFFKKSLAITLSFIFILFFFAFITHLSKPYVFENKVEVYRDMNIEGRQFSFELEYLTNAYEDIEVNYVFLTDDKGSNAYVQFDNITRYTTSTFLYKVNTLPLYVDTSLTDVISYNFTKLTIGFSDNSIIEKDLDYFKINQENDTISLVNFDNFIFIGINEDIQRGNLAMDTTLLSIESELYNEMKDYTNISFNDEVYKDPFNLELSEKSIFAYKLKFDEPNNLKDAYTKYVFDLKLNFENGVQYIYDNTYVPDYSNFFKLFKLAKLSGGN